MNIYRFMNIYDTRKYVYPVLESAYPYPPTSGFLRPKTYVSMAFHLLFLNGIFHPAVLLDFLRFATSISLSLLFLAAWPLALAAFSYILLELQDPLARGGRKLPPPPRKNGNTLTL